MAQVRVRQGTTDILVIGHRGAVGYAPENTLPAFQKGYELGADWIETDVKVTLDGFFVLMHDRTVDRTTDGTGNVVDLTLQEIKQLDAGSWFDPAYKGTGVPELKDLLNLAREKVGICLDLWSGLSLEVVERITQLVFDFGMTEQTLILSSNPQQVKYTKEISPSITTGLLYSEPVEDNVDLARKWKADILHPSRYIVNTQLIKQAHSAGIPVAAGVFSEEKWIRERWEWGLDIFNCDHPDLPRKLILGSSMELSGTE